MTTILLVEDDDAVRATMLRLLEHLAYTVRPAADAMEALHLITEELPDLVLADVRMPGKSGCWLIREITAAHPEVRCLLMSGYIFDEMSDQLTGIGECEETMPLLSKPFAAEKIKHRLEEVLAHDPWHSTRRRKGDR